MKKGAIFDFNGTLYLDHDINFKSWKDIFDKYTGGTIDFDKYYIERGNRYSSHQIVETMFEMVGKQVSFEKVDEIVEEKEVNYRQICSDLHRNKMINGAEKVLDYLKQNKIPVILCTCSIKSNVDYYYSNLNLERWFNKSQTVYIDNVQAYSTKTEMFKECARRLGVDIKDCVIFEDSPKAIKEAVESGCQNIVIQKRKDSPTYPSVKQIIEDYTKLDYSIFE